MPMIVTCGCGQRLKVNDSLAGQRASCPACGDQLQIPEVQHASPTATPQHDSRWDQSPASLGRPQSNRWPEEMRSGLSGGAIVAIVGGVIVAVGAIVALVVLSISTRNVRTKFKATCE